MTFTDTFGKALPEAEEATPGAPQEKRVTPPLLMGDILRARNGIPVFVTDWLRLEKERDARRAAKEALNRR